MFFQGVDVLQCVAVCCGVMQCVAVCCSVCQLGHLSFQGVGVFQCVAVFCSVLQRLAVLQCVAVCDNSGLCSFRVQVCCSVLQCAAG